MRGKREVSIAIVTSAAEIQVALEICRPYSTRAKSGTNFTLRYNRKALRAAVVVSSPTACKK
jgi:hypothetical protein